MDVETSFEADAQLAESGKPRMGAFDDPAIAPEAFLTFNSSASDACCDASLPEIFAAALVVKAKRLARKNNK